MHSLGKMTGVILWTLAAVSMARGLDFADVREMARNNVPENVIANMARNNKLASPLTASEVVELNGMGISSELLDVLTNPANVAVLSPPPVEIQAAPPVAAPPPTVIVQPPPVVYEAPVVVTQPRYSVDLFFGNRWPDRRRGGFYWRNNKPWHRPPPPAIWGRPGRRPPGPSFGRPPGRRPPGSPFGRPPRPFPGRSRRGR